MARFTDIEPSDEQRGTNAKALADAMRRARVGMGDVQAAPSAQLNYAGPVPTTTERMLARNGLPPHNTSLTMADFADDETLGMDLTSSADRFLDKFADLDRTNVEDRRGAPPIVSRDLHPSRLGVRWVDAGTPSQRVGMGDVQAAPSAQSHDTALTPADEQGFQSWASAQSTALGRPLLNDLSDYDLRGLYRSTGGAALAPGHFPDTFKKPNHPTFSADSQYSGRGGVVGGEWVQGPKGWEFHASAANAQNLGADGLADYFRRREPDARLVMSPAVSALANAMRGGKGTP